MIFSSPGTEKNPWRTPLMRTSLVFAPAWSRRFWYSAWQEKGWVSTLSVNGNHITHHNCHLAVDLIRQRWINMVGRLRKNCCAARKHVNPSHLLYLERHKTSSYLTSKNEYCQLIRFFTSPMSLAWESTSDEQIPCTMVWFGQGHRYRTLVSIDNDNSMVVRSTVAPIHGILPIPAFKLLWAKQLRAFE